MKKPLFNSIAVEITNICNLSCPFCAAGRGSDCARPKGMMSYAEFKKIINCLPAEVEEVSILGLGEPFLNPDMAKMIGYLAKNGLRSVIFTNGTVLDSVAANAFKKGQKLDIIFSVDGASGGTYSRLRKGGDFRQVLSNMSGLTELKKLRELSDLRIIWQFLITAINEHELNVLPEIAKKAGADILRLKTLSIAESDPEYNDFIPKDPNYRRKGDGGDEAKPCSFVDPGRPAITWDGGVRPCCSFACKDIYMGNAFKEGLTAIWRGDNYEKFRDDNLAGRNKICKDKCRIDKQENIYVKEFSFKC